MPKRKVMLIDDNEIDNFVSGEIIKDCQYAEQIIEMTSARDALDYLKNTDSNEIPEIIFLDIRMPVMDGFDFLDQFVKIPEEVRAHCSVIMLTSSTDIKDIDRALKYPVVKKFLAKPLRETMLASL